MKTNQKFDKKITVIYADDISIINRENYQDYYLVEESNYLTQPQSSRIEYVLRLIRISLESYPNTVIITNDYAFMRLLEHKTYKENFCIYVYDNDEIVEKFVDLKNNNTFFK